LDIFSKGGSSALTAIMLAERRGDEKANACSIGLCGNHVDVGRQRAQLLGDSSQGGAWIDRVKIPAGKRILAHTHPQDELVTVMEGTWYLGEGTKFNSAKRERVPRGQFHRHSGRRTSFCCGEGRYRDRSTQWQWQISHGVC
jgi:hypothetical protein